MKKVIENTIWSKLPGEKSCSRKTHYIIAPQNVSVYKILKSLGNSLETICFVNMAEINEQKNRRKKSVQSWRILEALTSLENVALFNKRPSADIFDYDKET